MIKISPFLVVIVALCAVESIRADGPVTVEPPTTELSTFFGTADYGVLPDRLVLDDRQLTVAVQWMDREMGIFDRAVVFEHVDDEVAFRLTLREKVFRTGSGEVILDLSEYDDLRGFSLQYSYPRDKRFETGILFWGRFGDEMRESEPIGIDWNPAEEVFRLFDLSNYEP